MSFCFASQLNICLPPCSISPCQCSCAASWTVCKRARWLMSGSLSAPTCLWRASSQAPCVYVPDIPWRRSCPKRSTASSKRSVPEKSGFNCDTFDIHLIISPLFVLFRWSCRKSFMSSTLWPTYVVRTAPYWRAYYCGSSDTRRLKPLYSGHSMTERLTWRVRKQASDNRNVK